MPRDPRLSVFTLEKSKAQHASVDKFDGNLEGERGQIRGEECLEGNVSALKGCWAWIR
jgi:hypothetical protein